jgi:hypothetical protein
MPSSTKPSPRRSRAPVALALLALAGCAAVGWSARALAGVGRLDTLAAGVVSYAVESKVRGEGGAGREEEATPARAPCSHRGGGGWRVWRNALAASPPALRTRRGVERHDGVAALGGGDEGGGGGGHPSRTNRAGALGPSPLPLRGRERDGPRPPPCVRARLLCDQHRACHGRRPREERGRRPKRGTNPAPSPLPPPTPPHPTHHPLPTPHTTHPPPLPSTPRSPP